MVKHCADLTHDIVGAVLQRLPQRPGIVGIVIVQKFTLHCPTNLPAQQFVVIAHPLQILSRQDFPCGDEHPAVLLEVKVLHHIMEHQTARDVVHHIRGFRIVTIAQHMQVIEFQAALQVGVQRRCRQIQASLVGKQCKLAEHLHNPGSLHDRLPDLGRSGKGEYSAFHGDGVAGIQFLELHQEAGFAAAAHAFAHTRVVDQRDLPRTRQKPVKPICVPVLVVTERREAKLAPEAVEYKATLADFARHDGVVHRQDDDPVEIQRTGLEHTHHLQALQRTALETDLLAADRSGQHMEQRVGMHIDLRSDGRIPDLVQRRAIGHKLHPLDRGIDRKQFGTVVAVRAFGQTVVDITEQFVEPRGGLLNILVSRPF